MIASTPEARKTEKRWLKVLSTLNEFQARLFVADKALDLGRGGISWLSQLTGMSRTTITKAVQELDRGFGFPRREVRDRRAEDARNWSRLILGCNKICAASWRRARPEIP